jgi:hypothetical protein
MRNDVGTCSYCGTFLTRRMPFCSRVLAFAGERHYPASMAPRGICKIKDGWANQDSAWVRYDNGDKHEMPENKYREAGHEPSFDELPECPEGGPEAVGGQRG